jgi:hypothetical protein
MHVFITALLPLARPDTDELPGAWPIHCAYIVAADARRQRAVARLTLLRFGMPEAAGGGMLHEHDQEDRSDDRNDKLTHQPKLGEVEQGEIADNKVSDNFPNQANHQIAEAPASHSAAREASGDGARSNLQRQIAKGHCKLLRVPLDILLVLPVALVGRHSIPFELTQMHLGPHHVAKRLRATSDEQRFVATNY